MSDFDKEFAADDSCINNQNIAKDAKVVDDTRSNSDDEIIDVDPELLADTSNLDYDLGITKLKEYTEMHVYNIGPNGKYRLR